ncbi:protein-export chaperone SecB [Acidiferrobacter sp.]|uniref:protein-export chaperone SecB n=1 Tax=Acidiferrobacter sp. TaxID=1872107 RepID=UPI0023535BDD|nr:protein-export chaperone SecB [Acidiferrobacter sp.]
MADQDTDPEIVFSLEKIYVKDISFEAPHVPAVFLEKAAMEVDMQLGIEHSSVNPAEGLHEVVLAVTVTARMDKRTAFLTETKQAGVFRITGVPDGELEKVLEIACPNILLPFAREVVNDLVSKGGFPQLLINPVNFEMLYQQKQGGEMPDGQSSH